jgi:multiple sugar transport system permease protein
MYRPSTKLLEKINKGILPYLLVVPAFLLFMVFSLGPLADIFRLSVLKTDYINSKFVGLANFKKIFTDPIFRQTIGNSFIYVLFIVPAVTLIATFISLLVVNMKAWIHTYIRFVFYVPLLASGVIIANVWRWIYHPRGGLLNWLLSIIGLPAVIWFGGRWTAIMGVSMVVVTSTIGVHIIIYLASIKAIPKELYEAALIDGANWRQIRLRIVLPQILPTVLLMMLMNTIGAFQVWESIFLLAPYEYSQNIMYSVYTTGFMYSHFGLASAKSLVLIAIILTVAIIQRRIKRA